MDIIIKNLPTLEFLNNLDVERDEDPSETIVEEEDEG